MAIDIDYKDIAKRLEELPPTLLLEKVTALDMTESDRFSIVVRVAIARMGMTITQYAERIQYTRNQVSNWCNGKAGINSVYTGTILQICADLNCSVDSVAAAVKGNLPPKAQP